MPTTLFYKRYLLELYLLSLVYTVRIMVKEPCYCTHIVSKAMPRYKYIDYAFTGLLHDN